LSKIDARQLRLEETPFDLRATVKDVCGLMEPLALGKGLELILRVAPGLPARHIGDPLRVRQILLNLLGNAVKFTEQGEVELSVTPRPAEAALDRPHLLFEVRDTGIGIPADKLTTIFESFRQADESTTRRFGGSGLGTTIARDLAQLMGGAIGVDSVEGRGSRFWVRLPLAPAEAPPPSIDGRLSGLR
ncbi:hybrid sensor histidine kinase/response regulator, partial [Rhodovibrio sodomensis]